MKTKLLIIFLLLGGICQAQDTIYFNEPPDTIGYVLSSYSSIDSLPLYYKSDTTRMEIAYRDKNNYIKWAKALFIREGLWCDDWIGGWFYGKPKKTKLLIREKNKWVDIMETQLVIILDRDKYY